MKYCEIFQSVTRRQEVRGAVGETVPTDSRGWAAATSVYERLRNVRFACKLWISLLAPTQKSFGNPVEVASDLPTERLRSSHRLSG